MHCLHRRIVILDWFHLPSTAEVILDCRTLQIEREQCILRIDPPSELHSWYLCVSLIPSHLLDGRPLCCSPFLQKLLSALRLAGWVPSVKKRKNILFRNCTHMFQRVGSSGDLNGYKICIPSHSSWSALVDTMWASFEPSLSEQRHQISSLHTWKQCILSAHDKKSVLSTQLRALGCGRQSINQQAKVEHCWHKWYHRCHCPKMDGQSRK